jgi:hypothetical protein
MRRFAVSAEASAGLSSFQKLSAGVPKLLAWANQVEIEPRSAPTTTYPKGQIHFEFDPFFESRQ